MALKKSLVIKCIFMGFSGVCAVVGIIIAYKKESFEIACLTIFSSFIPIFIWFLDAIENNKHSQKLEDDVTSLSKSLTWRKLK